MGAFSDAMKGVATDLIDRFGEDVVVDYKGVANSANTIKGFLSPYSPSQLDNKNVLSGDVMISMSADDLPSGVSISANTNILADGETWEVISSIETRTQGDSVLIEAQCRKIGKEGSAAVGRPKF